MYRILGWQAGTPISLGGVAYLVHAEDLPTSITGGIEYIGAIQDVTERRRSEQALAETRSELAYMARVASMGALSASSAHEVNQPLTGIIANGSACMRMLSADPPNVEGALETIRRTIRDSHRAADVVVRLRALFARREALQQSGWT